MNVCRIYLHLLGLVLVASLAAPVLLAQDHMTCSFDRELPAKVRWVAAGGEDLRVIVDWRDDPSLPARAVIRLFDDAGSQVARKKVFTAPGATSDILMRRALRRVPELGFQYRVAIERGQRSLAPEHNFRVFLDCSGSAGCVYELANGVWTSGALLMRDELLPVLDGLEASGSSNILGDALATGIGSPSQIYSLAWQLDRFDQRIPLGSQPCVWMPAFGGFPEKTESAIHIEDPDPPLPLSTFSYQNGAAHFSLARATGAQLESPLETQGQSRLTMDLRCWQIAEWQPVELAMALPSTPVLQFRLPVAGPGSSSVTANIESQARLEGKLAVAARGTSGSSATASADASFDVQVDGTSILSSMVATSAFAPSEGTQTDLICTEKTASLLTSGTRAVSVLDITSQIHVGAGPGAGSSSGSTNNIWLVTTGEALGPVPDPIDTVIIGDSPGGMTDQTLP